jgi:hypothetical protein
MKIELTISKFQRWANDSNYSKSCTTAEDRVVEQKIFVITYAKRKVNDVVSSKVVNARGCTDLICLVVITGLRGCATQRTNNSCTHSSGNGGGSFAVFIVCNGQ